MGEAGSWLESTQDGEPEVLVVERLSALGAEEPELEVERWSEVVAVGAEEQRFEW